MCIKLIIPSLFMFLSITTEAQELIQSAGGYCRNQNIEATYSIGEVFTETTANSSVAVTSGFNQPYIQIITNDIDIANNIKISIFPNPTSNILNINTEGALPLQLKVLTISGIIVKSCTLKESDSRIDFADMTSGMYVIKITNLNGVVNSYSIIKQ